MTDEHFHSDTIEVAAHTEPGCLVELKVTVKPLAVQAALSRAARTIKKGVSIPGFRKGKVPDTVIAKRFEKEVQKEWYNLVLNTAYAEATALVGRYPFSKSSLKKAQLHSCSEENGAMITFAYESEPIVPKIDLETLAIPEIVEQPVTQEEIDFECKRLQLNHAKWEDVLDRPVVDQDFVEIDIDVLDEPAHNLCVDKLFQVKTKEMSQWMYDLILGMQLHEAREGIAKPDPDSAEHATAEKLCRITLKKIRKADIPSIDDAFAKNLELENRDTLLKHVEKAVHFRKGLAARAQARSDLCHLLLRTYSIDLPHTLVASEIRRRLQAAKAADMKKGSLPVDALQEEQLAEEAMRLVRNFFTCMFLLRQFSSKVDLTASQQETYNVLLEEMLQPPLERTLFAGQSHEEMQERIFLKLMMRKCADYILDIKNSVVP